MKTNVKPYDFIDAEQGSDEWKAIRFDYVTASQLAAVVDLCPYKSREELKQEKLTRTEKPVSDFQKVIFERGHMAEEACREYAKTHYGIELTPSVVVSRKCPDLLASLDGFYPAGKVIFESKYMGQKSFDELKEGKIKPHHMIQVQAQLFATGAKQAIYFAWCDTGAARSIKIYPDPFYALFIPRVIEKFMKEVRE